MNISEKIYDYVKTDWKPKGFAYCTPEEAYKKYVPFVAFLMYISPDSFPFKINENELKELSSIVDSEDYSIHIDMIYGGLNSSKPRFEAFIREDGLYPETKKRFYVDFRQHFSMHNNDLTLIPESAFKDLLEWRKLNPQPNGFYEFKSFILCGPWEKLIYEKLD